jgi:hypothetical protein
MKIICLLFLNSFALAYEQPKVEDPHTFLDKLSHLISFKDTNVSLRGTSTVEMTKKLLTATQFQVQNYGRWNVSSRQYQDELQIAWKFK